MYEWTYTVRLLNKHLKLQKKRGEINFWRYTKYMLSIYRFIDLISMVTKIDLHGRTYCIWENFKIWLNWFDRFKRESQHNVHPCRKPSKILLHALRYMCVCVCVCVNVLVWVYAQRHTRVSSCVLKMCNTWNDSALLKRFTRRTT